MSDSEAYMDFRGWKEPWLRLKLVFDAGYVFYKIYKTLKLLNKIWPIRPLVRVLYWLVSRTYSCEVSLRANISGTVILPHPIGIVIGDSVQMSGVNVVYQNVTIGQNNHGYPALHNCTIYPSSVIAGKAEYKDKTFGALSRVIT